MSEHITFEYEVRSPGVEPYFTTDSSDARTAKRRGTEVHGWSSEIYRRTVVRHYGAWEKVDG